MSIELNEEQRRELWGIALLALALLLCLSLFPLGLLGSTGDRLFPTGNIVGVAGRYLAGGAWAIFGIPALLLPVFPTLWGLVAYRRLALRLRCGGRCCSVGSWCFCPPRSGSRRGRCGRCR